MRAISAIILLSLCSSFYADEPSPPILYKCPPPGSHWDNVAFEVFGQWLYLQPNGSNLYYAAEAFPYNTSLSDPAVCPNWQIFEVDPSYHSGFEVGVKCLFPNSDLNIELNWERLRTQDTDSMNVIPLSYRTGNMVGPIYDIGPNSSPYTSAKGTLLFEFDAANLLIEKSICFVKNLTLDLDLGVSFARIEQQNSAFYSNVGASTSRNIESTSTYWGIGPQFGLDIDYHIRSGVYFTGSTACSLYMGQITNKVTYQSNSPHLVSAGIPEPNTQNTTIPTRSQLIPGFEERLGFAYKCFFKRCSLNLEAGYLFQIYLNAIQSMDMLTQAVPGFDPGPFPNSGVYAVTFNRTLSNFILTGPYVSLNFGF